MACHHIQRETWALLGAHFGLDGFAQALAGVGGGSGGVEPAAAGAPQHWAGLAVGHVGVKARPPIESVGGASGGASMTHPALMLLLIVPFWD